MLVYTSIVNLKGYERHLIIKELSGFDGEVNSILNKIENYISFPFGGWKFIDRVQFLLVYGLDKVVSNCKN